MMDVCTTYKKTENSYKIWSENLKEPICKTSRPTVDGRVLLKCVFQKWNVYLCIELKWIIWIFDFCNSSEVSDLNDCKLAVNTTWLFSPQISWYSGFVMLQLWVTLIYLVTVLNCICKVYTNIYMSDVTFICSLSVYSMISYFSVTEFFYFTWDSSWGSSSVCVIHLILGGKNSMSV